MKNHSNLREVLGHGDTVFWLGRISYPSQEDRILKGLLQHLRVEIPRATYVLHKSSGQPYLANGSSISMSRSRSAGLLAIALSTCGSVGIDIERERSVRFEDEIGERVFGDRWRLRGSASYCSFLEEWTRREALCKSLGLGMSSAGDFCRVASRKNQFLYSHSDGASLTVRTITSTLRGRRNRVVTSVAKPDCRPDATEALASDG
jgi:phosphopantetheinyl transferase